MGPLSPWQRPVFGVCLPSRPASSHWNVTNCMETVLQTFWLCFGSLPNGEWRCVLFVQHFDRVPTLGRIWLLSLGYSGVCAKRQLGPHGACVPWTAARTVRDLRGGTEVFAAAAAEGPQCGRGEDTGIRVLVR